MSIEISGGRSLSDVRRDVIKEIKKRY